MAKKTDKCIECGKPLNEGEAKTFTCCDDCWEIAYASKPQSAQSEGAYKLGDFVSDGQFLSKLTTVADLHIARGAYAQGRQSMRAEYEARLETL